MIKNSTYKLKSDPSITDLLLINQKVYGLLNDRFFNSWEISSNQEKFMMRALKGIRKHDLKKVKLNLAIASSWYFSLMNRLHIDIEEAVWNRFPYLCSYCGHCPCVCKKIKQTKRIKITRQGENRPKTIKGYQTMFEKIYPSNTRTAEEDGIHLTEEDGELSEACNHIMAHIIINILAILSRKQLTISLAS